MTITTFMILPERHGKQVDMPSWHFGHLRYHLGSRVGPLPGSVHHLCLCSDVSCYDNYHIKKEHP